MTEAATKAPPRSRAKKEEAPDLAEEATTEAAVANTADASGMTIYQRINAISQEAGALAPEAKGGVPFAFRGIDGTVAHLTPFLHKYGVFNTSKVVSVEVKSREIGSRVVKTTEVVIEFEFFGPDGDSVTSIVPGLADDFGDRSTAQAMSVAYRIALLQLFHLPTHTREPEETGQAVMDAAVGGGAQPPRATAPKPVAQAKAAPPQAGGGIAQLQGQAKAIGQNLGLTPSELNDLGAEVSGISDPAVWYNSVDSMTLLVAALTAKHAATVQ